jgi:acetyltransferase-like isoleucine patch superfamily enzyme
MIAPADLQAYVLGLMPLLAPTVRILGKVEFGAECEVQDFVVLGSRSREVGPEDLVLRMGSGAVIRTHSVLYWGSRIGDRFQTGHGTLIRECNVIGDDVSVGSHTVIEHRSRIGHGVRIHSGSFIPEYCILEDGCWIGPRVAFTNVLHPLCPEAKKCIRGPRIGKGAKIGAGAVVLPHVVVGDMAVVGAGSVVVEDVPPRVVVGGNPARTLKGIDALSCPWDYIERPYPRIDPQS